VRVVGGLAAFHADGKLAGVEALLTHAVATPAAGHQRSSRHEDFVMQQSMPAAIRELKADNESNESLDKQCPAAVRYSVVLWCAQQLDSSASEGKSTSALVCRQADAFRRSAYPKSKGLRVVTL
jgi:hypothetical protein